MPLFSASPLLNFVSGASLSLCVLIVTYITGFCFIAPVLNSDVLNAANRKIFAKKVWLYYALNSAVLLTGIYHAVLCLVYPTPPTILCPNSSNLSPKLFTWNLHTSSCITLILLSGQVLLQSFNQLGPNSNFRIAPPKKLATTGLYNWVQHPSYTATFGIFVASRALFHRRDGGVACWLRKSVVDGWKFESVFTIGYWVILIAGCWALAKRVRDEESLLKETFGKEWEYYHKRTKRFLPGVI